VFAVEVDGSYDGGLSQGWDFGAKTVGVPRTWRGIWLVRTGKLMGDLRKPKYAPATTSGAEIRSLCAHPCIVYTYVFRLHVRVSGTRAYTHARIAQRADACKRMQRRAVAKGGGNGARGRDRQGRAGMIHTHMDMQR
jgi:hypothetical protein